MVVENVACPPPFPHRILMRVPPPRRKRTTQNGGPRQVFLDGWNRVGHLNAIAGRACTRWLGRRTQ